MIPGGKIIACDTETTGLNFWLKDRPFCFTFCNEDGDSGYYYFKVNPLNRKIQINPDILKIKEFFENDSITKVFHNAKFDLGMLNAIGIKVKGRVEDTLLMANVLRTNEDTLALKPLAEKYLNFPKNDETELLEATKKARAQAKKKGWNICDSKEHGKSKTAADYWLAPKKLVLRYAIRDVERTILLYKMFNHIIDMDKEGAYRKIYERNLELNEAIMAIERRGVRVSRKIIERKIRHHEQVMKESYDFLQKKLAKVIIKKGKIKSIPFNPSSGKQNAELVYGKLGFRCEDFTDKQNMKTGSKILRKFSHPYIDRIIAYQSSQKAISVFYRNFLMYAVRDKENKEWVIHPWYNLNGTDTGRLSGSSPNLQNVADANTTQALVPEQAREPFICRRGHAWLNLDYSGQELWIYANNSGDKDMLHELYKGSPHLKTARSVWPEEQQADEEKGVKVVYKRAKILLFSIIFGSGVRGIINYHSLPEDEARRVYDGIHKTYPGIRKFIEQQTDNIRKRGHIITPYGRKIHCDLDMGYKSANYSVQGTAADTMKKTIIKLHQFFTRNKIPAQVILTVHDDISIEIPIPLITSRLAKQIVDIVEDQPELLNVRRLPTSVALIEKNWAEKVEIKDLKELDTWRRKKLNMSTQSVN